MTELNFSQVRLSALDLPASIHLGLDSCGFEFCTPIQAQTLPLALNGQDVAGQAQTGTGKSAAFLIALFTRLLNQHTDAPSGSDQPRALIIAPTRELALQIHKDAASIGQHTGLRLALAYGGVDYEKQRKQIEAGCDVIIGTPGRVIDYFKQGVFNLKSIQVMVLDEADRMFDLGFITDVRYLMRRLPPAEQRLSMLFSATLSHRVLELAYEHMNNPESIKVVSDSVTAERVKQALYHPATEEKLPLLVGLLQSLKPQRSMIFVNTKACAERVKNCLLGNEIKADVLSGDVRQNKRQRLLQEFGEQDGGVLIATDVAARGLHINGITHVFNFDLPQQAEDYVHRIGRTARAGASGDAISFACEEYAFSLMDIEEYIKQSIPTKAITDDMLAPLSPSLRPPRKPRSQTGGSGGSRGNQRSGSGGSSRQSSHRSDTQRPRSSSSQHRSAESPAPSGKANAEAASPNASSAPAQSVDKPADSNAAPKRRRRRRSPSQSADSTQGTPQAPATPAASGGNDAS